MADATHAIWQDPTGYDHDLHGPPYLPPKTAAEVKPVVRALIRTAAHGKVGNHQAVFDSLIAAYGTLPKPELGALLAFLRTLAVIHQSHHWQTRGEAFYADHLLFDRLYNDVIPEIDGVAERAVGSGSRMLVAPALQVVQVGELTKVLYHGASPDPAAPDLIALSLHAELWFLIFVQGVARRMKAAGALSRGTDNLLAGIEDKHEEHVYLLKQRKA
jgi:DNA-binding ferritin-like protein